MNDVDRKNGKRFAVLEIFHDSDLGPSNVDFEHVITIHGTINDAVGHIESRIRQIKASPLGEKNEIEHEDSGEGEGGFRFRSLLVFASDDWFKFEVYEVEI